MKDGLPVHGYQPQSDDRIALVNEFKQDEERLLRKIDVLRRLRTGIAAAPIADTNVVDRSHEYDQRWLSIATTHFQQGFMALNRAVFQPQRIKLPEDED